MTNLRKAEKVIEKIACKRFLDGKNVSFIGGNFYERNSCCEIEIAIVSLKKQHCLAFRIARNSDNLIMRKGFFIINNRQGISNNADRILTRLDSIF